MATPEVGSKVCRRVAVLSLRNSQLFHREAGLLLRRRSWGHALALDRLALEELAKALIFRRVYDGFLTFKESEAKRVRHLDFGKLAQHRVKWSEMGLTVAAGMIWFRFINLYWSRARKGRSHGESMRYAAKQLKRDSADSGSSLVRQLLRLGRTLELLHRWQNSALYVDWAEGKISSPKHVKADDSRFVHERVRRWMQLFGRVIDPGIPPSLARELREKALLIRTTGQILTKHSNTLVTSNVA